MAISVKLRVFEGPLDLLLHLIEKNKVDIYDIPIVMITEQYMQYVNQMERTDLNVVSEFLVTAATLVDIKCRMLLPKVIDEEGNDIDPRQELVEQLIEYKLFKSMSFELKDKQKYADKAIYKQSSIPPEVSLYEAPIDLEKLLGDIDLKKLNEVFQNVMRRQENKIDKVRVGFGRIEKEEVSLPDKITYVKKFTIKNRKCSFKQLLEKQESKVEIIVTFLAVLELIKVGKIHIVQEHIFDDILISTT